MGRAVVGQRDPCLISGQRHAVELRKDDTTAHAVWVLDPYVIARRVVSENPRIWLVVSLQRAGIFREDWQAGRLLAQALAHKSKT
jgi:hypothetical protein